MFQVHVRGISGEHLSQKHYNINTGWACNGATQAEDTTSQDNYFHSAMLSKTSQRKR